MDKYAQAGRMVSMTRPTFDELDASEVHRLLARNHVARIVYGIRRRVDIEPISYVFVDGVIHMRTSPGSKVATLAKAPWVAFEVDEIHGPFDWMSVVVHGTVYPAREHGSRIERRSYRRALAALRRTCPSALLDEDPVPARNVILSLYPSTIIGRKACSARDAIACLAEPSALLDADHAPDYPRVSSARTRPSRRRRTGTRTRATPSRPKPLSTPALLAR